MAPKSRPDLMKLKPTTKNTKPRIQPSRKRPRAQPLFVDGESEPGSEPDSEDFNEPVAKQRTKEAARALEKQTKSTASRAMKSESKNASVFAGPSREARNRSLVRQTGSKAGTSVFANRMLRKPESDDESDDSNVQRSGRGGIRKESASQATESPQRRVSSRIQQKNALKFKLPSSVAKESIAPRARGNAASPKIDAVADDSSRLADCCRSPAGGDEVKSQSQPGSQLQLTVRAIRPKSRSKDALNKKQQAYERVKQERISETEMAFIREEFCVHYPPPPSNMAAAGRYELANRREMTKAERDALWENELKPWSERWWLLYGKFTDLVRAEKMKKPVTASTDVRRGECKKWAKAFRKKHGDARPQSRTSQDASGESASKSEGKVGVAENEGAGSGSQPDVKNGMSSKKASSDVLGVLGDEGGCPTADLDSCSNVASQSVKSDVGLSVHNDSKSDFQFDSQSDPGLIGVSPLESQSDPGVVGVSPIRDDGHAIDSERKGGTVLNQFNAVQSSFGSAAGTGEVEKRFFEPSSASLCEPQSCAAAGVRPQETTNHKDFRSPVLGRTQCAAFVDPATEETKHHEDDGFLEPLAGGRTDLKADVPKVGACGIGDVRIPKKQVAGRLADTGVGQRRDYRVHHDGSGAIGALRISRAVDSPLAPPRGAVEFPTAFRDPNLPRPSTAGALATDGQPIPCGQSSSVPLVLPSPLCSAPESDHFASIGYDPEHVLMDRNDTAGPADDVSFGNSVD